ncbi:MAG TPA: spore coat biosynthesis protein F [Gammaproteobacteria bacterium]|nr:spore coat biosynthesis protein F [Gammaproteobacteria bacterium]
MKIVASIQARLSSTRLPGKVLKEIAGKPMLQWQIERLQQSRLIDDIVVATTTNPADDRIVEFCNRQGYKVFRGDEDNVLQRLADLIVKYEVDIHVECFGDSPLTDPRMVDEFIGYLLKHQNSVDFVSNSLKTTYPPGSEVIVYKGGALIKVNGLVEKSDPLREHVSLHIYRRTDLFAVMNLEAPSYLYYPDLYMEVDTPEDFQVMTFVIENMMARGHLIFSIDQVVDLLLDNPDISSINRKVNRRWKEYRNDD